MKIFNNIITVLYIHLVVWMWHGWRGCGVLSTYIHTGMWTRIIKDTDVLSIISTDPYLRPGSNALGRDMLKIGGLWKQGKTGKPCLQEPSVLALSLEH